MVNIKKVLMLVGYFMPTLGYQENGWAKALVQMGIKTKVISHPYCLSKFKTILDQSNYRPGKWQVDGYEIERVPVYLKFRSMAWPIKIKTVIQDFEPDVVVSFGIGAILPNAGVKYKDGIGYKLVCTFGDNPLQRPRNPKTGSLTLMGFMRELAFKLFKKPMYRKAIKKADLVGFSKPITFEILRNCLKRSESHFVDKITSIPLGYDPEVFYWSESLREKNRKKFGFDKDDVIVVSILEIKPSRGIELLLDKIQCIMKRDYRIKVVLGGFLKDDYEQRVKKYIYSLGIKDKVICLPLISREELNGVYNAADIGIWHLQPTITIIEALGAGLPIVIPEDPCFSLQGISDKVCKSFEARNYEHLEYVLEDLKNNIHIIPNRSLLADINKCRTYQHIIRETFSKLRDL